MKKSNGQTKKILTKEIIFYTIFGILSTAVNIGSFYILSSFFYLPSNTANLIAISLAVLVAYFTNKDLVFHSQADEFGEKVVEFCKFILDRLFTIALEYIACALLFRYTPIPAIINKCIISTFMIVLNFFIIKFFAFKTQEEIS